MNDRRVSDRRRQLISLRYPDRRRGFPRRSPRHPLVLRYNEALETVRERDTTTALLVALLMMLGLTDLSLTHRALAAGGVEVNPVMAALFEAGTASIVKVTITALVAAGFWFLRRYRSALAALIGSNFFMGMVVVYQASLVARYG